MEINERQRELMIKLIKENLNNPTERGIYNGIFKLLQAIHREDNTLIAQKDLDYLHVQGDGKTLGKYISPILSMIAKNLDDPKGFKDFIKQTI